VDDNDPGGAALSLQDSVTLPGQTDSQRFRGALEHAVGAAIVNLQLPLIGGRYQEAPDPLDRVTPVVDAPGVVAFRDRARAAARWFRGGRTTRR
jgi:hypothetical protein